MKIDDLKYSLGNQNYTEIHTIKTKIIIGHLGCDQDTNFIKWSQRLNGKYKKTAAFSIDKNGNVFKHFDPTFYSDILGNTELDRKSIVILLENDGWLTKDLDKNLFLNWIGYIYNNPEEVIEKKWRNYSYWAPYSKEQFLATLELVNKLCNDFKIPKVAIGHNTRLDALSDFSGVLYKSNIEKHFTDLSPAWNYESFKQKLEKYEKGSN